MKKRDYQRPTMTVVELQHRTRLLTGSNEAKNVSAQRNGYVTADEQEWN